MEITNAVEACTHAVGIASIIVPFLFVALMAVVVSVAARSAGRP
jgi:hypothetical protein